LLRVLHRDSAAAPVCTLTQKRVEEREAEIMSDSGKQSVDSRGFTLIELLVVISVIALLLAILLPVLGRVRKQAQATGCQARLRQWSLFYAAYAAENDGRMCSLYPSGHQVGWIPSLPCVLPTELDHSDRPGLDLADLDVYKDLLLCPTARVPPASFWDYAVSKGGGYTRSPWWFADGLAPGYRFPFIMSSYGQNAWMPADGPLGRPRWVNCSVKGTSRVPVYLDSRLWHAFTQESDVPPDYEDACTHENVNEMPYNMVCFVMNRHHGAINGLFMDWSVRKVGLKEPWTLKWCPDFDTAGPWTQAGGVQPENWPAWMRKYKDY
jgi:prepilin-type N-terminal cleavage/methylation domain-containing protein